MCRKLFLFALVFGLASASYGNTDPISNWETASSPDGWAVCTWGTQGDTTFTPGATVGVTRGVGSAKTLKTLNHLDTGGKTWGWNLIYASWNTGQNLTKAELWDAVHAGKQLEFDITYDPISMTGNAAEKFFDSHFALQIDTTGGRVDVQWEHLAAWDGLNRQTFHISLDTTATKDGLDAVIGSSAGINWIQMPLGWQAGPGWDGVATLYYDDLKLVVADPIPIPPTGLTALAGNRKVLLDWNNNSESDLAGYRVYRSTTQGADYGMLSAVSESNHIDTNSVTNGVPYYYVVTAVDTSLNESGYSNEASDTGYRLAADINGTGDGYVDYEDLDILAWYWLYTDCATYDNCEGADFVPTNGAVDFHDFSDFASQWMWCNDPLNPSCWTE